MTENNSTSNVNIASLNKFMLDNVQINHEDNGIIQFDQKTNENHFEEHVQSTNNQNLENSINNYFKNLHNSTSSSGYGSSFFSSSNDNSVLNQNDSMSSTPRTPKTQNMLNSNIVGFQLGNSFDIRVDDQNTDQQYHQLINNDFMARMGINFSNLSNDSFAKRLPTENSISKSTMRQRIQTSISPNKNVNEQNQNEIRFDPFGDYIGVKKMINNANNAIKNAHSENIFSSLINQANLVGNNIKLGENKFSSKPLDHYESTPSIESNTGRLLNQNNISMDMNQSNLNFNNNYHENRFQNLTPETLDSDSFNLNSSLNKNQKIITHSLHDNKLDRSVKN